MEKNLHIQHGEMVILVATHKAFNIPQDSIYLPIHVGKKGKEDLGYAGDDTGENISYLNSTWCELTGLYWGWKNLECDYLGLVQYRRYFKGKNKGKSQNYMSGEEAKRMLAQVDIILPKKRNYVIMNLAEHFNGYDFTVESDLRNLREAVHRVDSAYDKAFDTVMNRKSGHMCNMFVMKKTLLDQFCSWEFAVLETFESLLESERPRLIGYAAEHMLDIWIEKNGYDYAECDVAYGSRKNELDRRFDFIMRKLGCRWRRIDLAGEVQNTEKRGGGYNP